jgi:regulatory protein
MRRRPPGDSPPSARDAALGLLARREHSRRDLKRKLAARGIDADSAEAALEELGRERYQSDERFAEAVVRHRAGAGYGPRHILAELGGHGIAAAAVRPLLDAYDWADLGAALVRRKRRRGAEPQAERQRLMGLLQRRGFPVEAIRAALGKGSSLDEE